MTAALAEQDIEVQEALEHSKRTFGRKIEMLHTEQDMLQYERRNEARRMKNDMDAMKNEMEKMLEKKYSAELQENLREQKLDYDRVVAKLSADKDKLRNEQIKMLEAKIEESKRKPPKERTALKLLLSLVPVLGTVALGLLGIPLSAGSFGGGAGC